MKKCINCGKTMNDEAKFCIYCGTKLDHKNYENLKKINPTLEKLVRSEYTQYKKFIHSNIC